jgi:LmbE family N-acetylglucosaminyl deacetylase
MNIIFIFAHPDDESFGPGGTIAKLAVDNTVHVFSLCNGARPGNEAVSSQRVDSFYKACESFGASSTIHNVPDLALTVNATVSKIETIILQMKPDVVYTHSLGDIHRDHRAVAEATMVACRPKPESTVKELYFCEIPASSDWSFCKVQPTFEPNVFVDVSDFIDVKKKALSLYHTETYRYPDARSIESMETRAKFRGTQIGVNYAEAFQLVFSRR